MAAIVELREKSDDALLEMLENAREEMFNLRFQHASARLDDISRLRTVRREIAQLETVLHLRDLAVETALLKPEVAEAVDGQDWVAAARYVYEDAGWRVDFFDGDDNELATTLVNLNRKRLRGRRARKQAKR